MIRKNYLNSKLSSCLNCNGFQKSPEKLCKILVEIASRKTDRILAVIDANKGRTHREIKLLPSIVAELPYNALIELAQTKNVIKIWHDAPVYAYLNIAVPAIGGPSAWQSGFKGKGVNVVVLDTGIYPHRDLALPTNRIVAWHDLVNKMERPYDDNGHGTHIAGIIAGNGRASNGEYKGVAPEAQLIGVKVLNSEGTGDLSTVLSGIEWCLENQKLLNIKIINFSMGTMAQESYRTDPLCRAVKAAWDKGILVCAAAGNDGPETGTINSPGISPVIITVGNMDDHQTVTSGDDVLNRTSSRGPTIDNLAKPDLVAPGTRIVSIWKNGGYKALTGTSMSTPFVSGAAALLMEKWPTLSPEQIKQKLIKNTRNLGLSKEQQGAGALNLEKVFKVKNTEKTVGLQGTIIKMLGYQMMKQLMAKAKVGIEELPAKFDKLTKKTLIDFIDPH